jgi:hypothetical protein
MDRMDVFVAAREAIRSAGTVERVVAAILPDARLRRGEWWGCSPLREDRHAGSFSVRDEDGVFFDFASGDRGDLVTLVARSMGIPLVAAAQFIVLQLAGTLPCAAPTPSIPKRCSPRVVERPLVAARGISVPSNVPGPDFPGTLDKNLRFSGAWCYRDEVGRQVMWMARFDHPESTRKTYRPWHPVPNGWRVGDPVGELPVYHLDELSAYPTSGVVVVEGERAADAAAVRFPGLIAVTSAHGAGSAGRTDWRSLQGRNIVLWGDNDVAGKAYIDDVVDVLASVAVESLRRVQVPSWLPCGWDLADPCPDGVCLETILRSSIKVRG